MSKVPNCKGSYQKRKSGTGYQVKYPLGWSDEKKKYDEYREDVPSEAEAIVLIKELNAFEFHGGKAADIPTYRSKEIADSEKSVLTFREFAEHYCAVREQQKAVKPKSIRSDRECINRVLPYIGDKPVQDIASKDIDEMYAAMRSGKKSRAGGIKYSGTTLERTHAVISAIFKKAIAYEIIDKNPCGSIAKPKNDTPERRALTVKQAQALYMHIISEPLTAHSVAVLIGLYCGLRLSEMLALTWSDYSDDCLFVDKSQVQDRQEKQTTKNEESRPVTCPPQLIDVLDDWQEQQKRWMKDMGLKFSKSTPIITNAKGGHILQSNYDRWFNKARKRYPIPDDFKFHELRHTYVTFVNRECEIDEKTTRTLSGHKTLEAFQIYTHTNTEWMREAAKRLGTLISPVPPKPRCQYCALWTASPLNAEEGCCWSTEREQLAVTSRKADCDIGCFAAA